MRGALVVVVAVVLLTSALVPAVGPAAGEQGDGDGSGGFAALVQTGDVEADAVSLRATVAEDGDAEWRIAYRVRLDDENTTRAFESLRTDVEANESAYAAQFESRMGPTVAAAENATGREMELRNVSVTAQRDPFQEFGVVAYTFTWEGFAATNGDRLVVGDALSGLFLDAETSLTVAWPDEYEARGVDPAPDDRTDTSVTWEGDRGFGPDQPRVTVAPASALPASPGTIAVAALALLTLVGGAWVYRNGARLPGAARASEDDAASVASPAAGSSADPGGRDDPAAVSGGSDDGSSGAASGDAGAVGGGAGSGGAGGGEAGGGAAAGDAGGDEPPEELLSPRERVLRLVESNGGRMKQAGVTDALGWSAARTSQVVGDLRDDGELESFRLGRENVLRFPENAAEDRGADGGDAGGASSDDADAGAGRGGGNRQ